MTRRNLVWCGGLAAAFLVSATLSAARASEQGDTPTPQSAADGAYLFRTYCASCHGTSAQGNGPLADSLRRRPSNLTEIAKRNNGTFPKDLVFRIVDGRRGVRGHGGPDMPVWGDAFLRSIESGTETAVAFRIQALVDYLETIQARDTQ